MTVLSDETQSMLELLTEVRRAQSQTIERMTNDWRHAMHLRVQVDKLGQRVSKLRSAVPSDPTSAQIAVLQRDVKEFRADVSEFKSFIGELVAMTNSVKTDMTDIKTMLDTLQTQIEESDL